MIFFSLCKGTFRENQSEIGAVNSLCVLSFLLSHNIHRMYMNTLSNTNCIQIR